MVMDPSSGVDAVEETSERCAALLDALRIADAPADVLASVRAHLVAATRLLDAHARPGPHAQSARGMNPLGRFDPAAVEPHELMPWSPIIGRRNPVSPRLAFRVEGSRLLGSGRIPVRFVGAPQTVHGGIVAAVLDEIMGLTNFLNDAGSFTGEMTVRFHRPTPIERELDILGETVSVEGRKVRSRAEIRVDGELCASAEALFIRPR
jgi:hypothetical protein